MKREPRVKQLGDGRWQVEAPAKLNLGLRVSPLRADGYHDVETWMVATSWHDTVWVEVGGGGSEISDLKLQITGRSEGVPTEPEKNLAGRAALALAAAAGVEPRGRITLHKVLPHGGGIGGGSSDAASTLLALNEAWGLNWPAERLATIAAGLGSDVPFFLEATPSLCTGRGTTMRPLVPRHLLFAVLLIPPMGCPTKAVYQTFDAGKQHVPARAASDWEKLAGAEVGGINALLVNDLEPAAFFVAPALGGIRERAAGIAGMPVHMSGSGSTLFTLCGSGAEAGGIAEKWMGMGGGCVSVPVRIG